MCCTWHNEAPYEVVRRIKCDPTVSGLYTVRQLNKQQPLFSWTTFPKLLCRIINYLGDLGFSGGSEVKNLPANAGDTGSIHGLGRSPEEGNGTPLQYPCLGNPMDRGTWQATIHEVEKSQTQLSSWARARGHTGFKYWWINKSMRTEVCLSQVDLEC